MVAGALDAKALKAKHRLVRDAQSTDLATRIHRAISWLARAETETDDPDARFLFLWIGLNAAYAQEFGFEESERVQSGQFIDRVLSLDDAGRLQDAVFRQFSGPIRTLVENKYVFEPFWRALREHDSSGNWEARFARSREDALRAVLDRQTAKVLSVVLDRLHVLRNQLVHGGATWNSAANRAQVRDGAAILMTVLPIIIELMMASAGEQFGAIAYPNLPG